MLIGHEKIIEDLKRLAVDKSLSHGYIFHGPAMVGKRTAALHFANFLETGEFSNPKILQDCLLAEPDEKGTLGIGAVRSLKNFLWQKPNASQYRTAIIDGGEALTTEAQNALLKITEEPPQSSLLILITSDVDGLLPTITSRLQKIYFGTMPGNQIEKWLVDDFSLPAAKAKNLAEKSFGKPGLAARLINDKKLAENLKLAERFLKNPAAARRDFIKTLIEPEDFNFRIFLDAVIVNLSWTDAANRQLWHKTLKLRRDIANFSLNPRLQLENLLTN